MSFKFKKNNAISGIILIENQVFSDERGFFTETYKASEFLNNSIVDKFVQENHSRSKKGVLRGLHYQINRPQGKLIWVADGEIFDVAVDIRRSSKTFGQWFGITLSSTNARQLYIPEGFAHGFLVKSDTARVVYKCTEMYNPSFERGIIWNDTTLKIDWPSDNPVLSEKDRNFPKMKSINPSDLPE